MTVAVRVATLLLLSLTACSSSDSGSNSTGVGGPSAASGGGANSGWEGGAGPASLEEFCSEYATRLCELTGPCCEAEGVPFDAHSCVERHTVVCEMQYGRYEYDRDLAAQCLDAQHTLVDCAYGQHEMASCTLLASARVRAGGECGAHGDCVPGYACIGGRCSEVPAVLQGESCSDPTKGYCAEGLECSSYRGVGDPPQESTCRPFISVGVSCREGACPSGFCDPQTGLCEERPAVHFCAMRGR